jgi:hypothetical protein
VAQRLLADARPGTRIELVNLGVSGLATRHSVKRLEEVGFRYHPDLIVYGYTLNDIEGDAYVPNDPEARPRRLAAMFRFGKSPSLLLRVVWPRLLAIASALRPARGTYEYELERNYLHNPKAWAEVTRGLDRLAAIAQERGICALVFIHARPIQLRWFHPFGRFYDRVEQAARDRGLAAAQAFPWLRGRDAPSLRISFSDPHPNAAGQRLHGEALDAALRALPERCWQTPGRD